MMSSQKKIESFFKTAVNKQLEMAGISLKYEDVLEIEDWYDKLTITPEQSDDFHRWFIGEYKTTFRSNNRVAGREYSYFNLSYGLRIL